MCSAAARDDGRPTALYYQPTVVDGVGLDTLVNREETFGPIVPLVTVDSDDEALAGRQRLLPRAPGGRVHEKPARAFRYLEKLRVGNVVVNDSTDYWEAHEPFGGASGTRTGWGRIGGRYTMLDMTDLRTVVLDFGQLRLGSRRAIGERRIGLDELRLAARNHALPLEALRYPITPVGLHYLLIHYDIPLVEAGDVPRSK